MNGKEQAIESILQFIKSDEKSILITGTHQFNKHKLVMAILDKYFKNAKILFRVNSMDNVANRDFAGFVGIKRKPKSGDNIRIRNNIYQFDSFNRVTWGRTNNNFDFGILYPLDAIVRNNMKDTIENFMEYKNINKVFLISWTDNNYDYSTISKYYSKHIIYDALEEDENYHNRVLDHINNKRY